MEEQLLSLKISAREERHPVGKAVPVAIFLKNMSMSPVWMVGVLDGSESGLRYPLYRPEIHLKGILVAEPFPPEDPLVGPLRLSDLTKLEPGESFDPTQASLDRAYLPLITFVNFFPATAGIYQFQLILSTESENPEQWLGTFGQETERDAVLKRVLKIPRGTFRSNTLEIEIT
jgi:hypothetical protein